MLESICDDMPSGGVDLCQLDFINITSICLSIICFGAAISYLLTHFRPLNTELLYLHNWRSLLVIALIFVQICELAEASISVHPPLGFVTSPLSLISSGLSLLGTIFAATYVRIVERRDQTGWLYLAVFTELIQFITKICKLVWISQDFEIYSLHPFLTTASTIVMLLLTVVDSFTCYAESHQNGRRVRSTSANENIGYKHPYSTFLSKCTFWWLTPLLCCGYLEPLELEDLGNLYEDDTSRFQYDQFLFNYQGMTKKPPSLWICYFKTCWKQFAFGGLLKLFGDFAALVGPLSISIVVDYIEAVQNSTATSPDLANEYQHQNNNFTSDYEYDSNFTGTQVYYPSWNNFLSNGWIIAIFILLSSLAQGTFSQSSTHLVNMVGVRLKTAIQGLIYRKTLSISSCCFFGGSDKAGNNFAHNMPERKGHNGEEKTDVGAITNLMSDDAQNVMYFFWIAHYVWAIPLKIAVVIYFLYLKLGMSAVIGALICVIIMTPLQFLIGKFMSKNAEKIAEATDERLKKLNEILMGIRIIKLNAWEKVFKEKLRKSREKELKLLNIDSIYWTLITFFTHVASIVTAFVTLAIFIHYEKNDNIFTSSRVFSALALFNQLTVALFIFPITVPIIISAIISTRRLQNFLALPEVQKEFEGIRNMARIFCRSDGSLDIYEKENNEENDECNKVDNDQENNSAKNEQATFENDLNNENCDYSSYHLSLGENVDKVALEKATESTTGSGKGTKIKKRNLSMSSQLERNRFHRKSTMGQSSSTGTLKESSLIAESLIVSIRNGMFIWYKNENIDETLAQRDEDVVEMSGASFYLSISQVDIPKGQLTVVVGKSASGKSSLLAALLREIPIVSGELIWNRFATIAYVSQRPWLLNASIRDNILFGESFRPKRYDKVLEVCALKPDIELMPSGDTTDIGECGINLSGGQRQRIAIARALYSSANVIIMDDPFSSLDHEVSKFIFENGIKKMLLNHKRTIIMVTQNLQLIYSANYIIALEGGKVRATGTLSEIEKNDLKLTQEWQSIVHKENTKHLQLSPGRTARERWRLFKNVTRLGLQRISAVEEDEMSSSKSLYVPSKKRASTYGSRHLTYDIPLPIDECHDDEVEIRKRPGRRGPNNSILFGDYEKDNHKNILRANSLQVAGNKLERTPVARNISTPITLQYLKTSSSDQKETDSFSSKLGFQQFLRRMSSRRSKSNVTTNEVPVTFRDKFLNRHHTVSTSDSIKSISEEEHLPVKKLISTISKYSEEGDEESPDYNEDISNRLIYDEERKYGTIPTRIYLLYLRACGLGVVSIFCLSALGWQALRVYTDIWLRDWTDTSHDENEENDKIIMYYFKVYAVLSGICVLLSMVSTPAGQYAGNCARRKLHDNLLDSVLNSSMHFFQTTPLGRIMNRFSNDMSIVDKKIAPTSQRLLQFLLLCLCAMLINAVITPWFILLTLPICGIYYGMQRFYRSSSRELQRIESITTSPIISHFSETIQGVATIRAYNQEARFMEMLFKRMEANNVAFIILNTSNRWLGIALDYLGGVIVFLAIITALFTSRIYPETTPSLVGLAINYTLLVPIYLNWVVKLLADMEMYIGAVERIEYYIKNGNLECGAVYKSVPISWPQKGDIVFENVSLQHEGQKQNIISNLNLTIPAGQRIGICGRTGSGKSSLALSLFGVLKIAEGRILIDDVDISEIYIDELRSRLSIIPQDVILFSGTIRDNLDPRGHFSDLELWNCLEIAQLKDAINSQSAGLDAQIIEGGSNFSAGQKQLFCLARAVLRGSACLILDEATSSLDTTTEMALLQAASNAFEGRTVITIAHRLTTLLTYDRVIVLENGQVAEDGDPRELKGNANSKFATMLKASLHETL